TSYPVAYQVPPHTHEALVSTSVTLVAVHHYLFPTNHPTLPLSFLFPDSLSELIPLSPFSLDPSENRFSRPRPIQPHGPSHPDPSIPVAGREGSGWDGPRFRAAWPGPNARASVRFLEIVPTARRAFDVGA